jgi:polysaccharide biosynthesis transport protein
MLLNNNPDNDSSFQNEESISLSNIFHAFWLHRWVFFLVVMLVSIVGASLVFQLIPRYTSETKLLVGTQKSQVVDVKAVLSGDMTTESAIKSEAEVMLSRGLVRKVIIKLNLLNLAEFNPSLERKKESIFSALNPKNWLSDNIKDALGLMEKPNLLSNEEKQERLLSTATDIYLSKLKVAPIKLSQIITVTFESLDPKLAAKIANTHADSYIIGQLEAKFEATEKANSWLNAQLTDLRVKVANSEKAVEIYRAEHGLARGSNKDVGLASEQLSEINSQLIIAKAQKAEASARLAQVTKLLDSGAEIETASEVLSSSLIQNLRGQEAELIRKHSEMATELGAKHPQLISINEEINKLREKINAEIVKIAAGLRNELNIASAREASLESSLAKIRDTSSEHGKEEVQLRALEREANANKLLFETFLNRFKETTSTHGMEQADARVISAAEVSIQPTFPRKKFMLAVIVLLALGMGSALVLLLEVLNSGFRTPEAIEAYLGFSAIGVIPKSRKKLAPYDYLLEKPNSNLGEAICSLRMSLMLSDPDKCVNSLIVTSAALGEGKSILALSLARSAAIAGQKVIVIDADFRRPSLEKELGISTKAKGLTDLIMSHDNNLSEFIYKDEKSSLMVMPKGNADYISPVDIFASQRMRSVLATLRAEFDLIIFDTPPVLAVTDARVLAPLVDKVVFVVAWDKTPRKVVKAGLEQILKITPNLAGIVLQQVDLQQYNFSSGGSAYYYYLSKHGAYYSN